MTLASTASRVSYTGNGVTTSFSFPYYFVNKSDLVVYVDGVLKILNTDYTIAGTAPFPTGQNIVFGVAPANLASIVIARVVPYTQTLDLVENDPLPAEDLEKRFDLTTMMIQQIKEALDRAIVIPITDVAGTNTIIPGAATRANQALLFDASGNVTVGLPTSATISAAMQPVTSASTLALARTAFGATTVGNAVFTAADAATARTALGAAAFGANTDITSLAGITSINGGQLGGFRNKIINGDFRRWDYATTYALTTSVAYGSANRWWSVMTTSAAGVFNQDTSIAAPNSKYNVKMGRNSLSSLTNPIYAGQCFESVNSIPLAGKTVTLSFSAKKGTNFSGAGNALTVTIKSGTGSDQSSVSYLADTWTGNSILTNGSVTLTSSVQRFSVTVAVPSNSTQLGFNFSYTPAGTAGADDNAYIKEVQLEVGSVATPFEDRGEGIEFLLCARYFVKFSSSSSNDTFCTGTETSTTNVDANIKLPVPMRIPPTGITVSSGSHVTDFSAGAARVCTTVTFGSSSTTMCNINAAIASGGTTGLGTRLYFNTVSGTLAITGVEL